MESNPSQHSAADLRWWARDRYPNRPLFWSMSRHEAGCARQLLASQGARSIRLSASRPVEPGRSLLLQLPGAEPGCTTTLFARVASVARRPDGSWLVRCDLAGSPQWDEVARSVA
jgi:hypothetical protein